MTQFFVYIDGLFLLLQPVQPRSRFQIAFQYVSNILPQYYLQLLHELGADLHLARFLIVVRLPVTQRLQGVERYRAA